MADLIRKALIELVDLQDMKVAMAKLAAEPDYLESPPKIAAYDCMATSYASRRAAAWEAARAALNGVAAADEPEAILARARQLIADAQDAGQVVRIDLVPRQPLAMGSYDMVVDVRDARS